MSYAKNFINDYFRNPEEIYKPTPINYLIYNVHSGKFRSSNIPIFNHECEHLIETLATDNEFTIFISHSIDTEYLFVELTTLKISEERIYDYYNFYDISQDEIDIVQEYSVFIDCSSNVYNITTTKYSSAKNKNIDSFEIVHFSEENYL